MTSLRLFLTESKEVSLGAPIVLPDRKVLCEDNAGTQESHDDHDHDEAHDEEHDDDHNNKELATWALVLVGIVVCVFIGLLVKTVAILRENMHPAEDQ